MDSFVTSVSVKSGKDPEAAEPPVMGYCTKCGESLRYDYTYFSDNEGNTFCDKECAMKHYGIEEKEW